MKTRIESARVIAFLAAASMLAVSSARAQRIDMIPLPETWRYFKGLNDPPPAWKTLAMSDTSWLEGRMGIGYSDDDDITVLDDMKGKYKTVYARRAFSVDDPAALRKLFLKASYDDGFVAYVNGAEVARRGLGSPGSPVNHDTSATSHEYGVMDVIDLSPAIPLLVKGQNLLAVEIHNQALSGDDLSFSPALRAHGSGPAIARGPYLQRVTQNSVLVVWQTDPPGAGAVEYGASESLGMKAEVPGVLATHEVLLSNLEPGTEHFYRLLAGDVPLSPVYRFTTAPPAAASRFRMAVLGDTEKPNDGLFGAVRVVEAMKPGFFVIVGDVIRDGDADGYAFDPWLRVHPWCPFFTVPGNHDAEGGGQAYLEAFSLPSEASGSELYYSFNYGNAHIVGLDVSGTSYAAGSRQNAWLRADLAGKNRLWAFVFLHEAPYSTGTVHGSSTAIRRDLIPIFDEFKVDLVFSGHNHNFERSYPARGGAVVDRSPTPVYTDPAGTIYIVTGGAGGSLYAQNAGADKTFSAFFTMANHVCQIDVEGSHLTLKAIDLAGAVFQTLEIQKTEIDRIGIGDIRVAEVRETSATIAWTTEAPADSKVEYGLQGDFDLAAFDGALVTDHILTIAQLNPGTRYEARVRSSDQAGNSAVSDPVPFETLDLFVRGDANRDRRVDVSDAVEVLLIIFSGSHPSRCPDAADANDSGTLDVADPIRILGYLFAAGVAPPPSPFPTPGDDPTADSLDCRVP